MMSRVTGDERRVQLAPDPQSIAFARSVVNDFTSDLAPAAAGDAELLTSELVTNAIRYGGSSIELTVSLDEGTLTVAVYDDGEGTPRAGDGALSPGAVSGRGLQMVDRVAQAWGVASSEPLPGKTVWFRITADHR